MKDIPAFPTGFITDDKGKIIGGSNGMTLRDYFAAKAMQALLQKYATDQHKLIADKAYDFADAMIKAREL